MSSIEIINGDHDPALPFMVVDRHGMHVDFSTVTHQLYDQNTVAKVEWGLVDQQGRLFGRVTLKNGTGRTFWDADLMTPYLNAYKATKAALNAAAAVG